MYLYIFLPSRIGDLNSGKANGKILRIRYIQQLDTKSMNHQKMVVFFVLKQFCFDNSNSIIMTIRGSDYHLMKLSVLLLNISYNIHTESVIYHLEILILRYVKIYIKIILNCSQVERD